MSSKYSRYNQHDDWCPKFKPYHKSHGRRSPNNKQRPDAPYSPTPLPQEDYPDYTWGEIPHHKNKDWDATSEVAAPEITQEWNPENVPWDTTREIKPRPVKMAREYNDEIYAITREITAFDICRLTILPNLPKYVYNQGANRARQALTQLKRAKEILQEAYSGHISYGAA